MTKSELLQKADSLPLLPGVYLMMDKNGEVIYVGKAKKLKNRVSQYFQETSSHNEKTRNMVAAVDRFDTIVVRSEFEALVLENSLIKRHQPRYNILLKDDKGYPFVRLDEKAAYPRFTLASKSADDGAAYFGPFGGRHETRAAIDAVCAGLKLPTCRRQFPRDIGKERPCLNHHIGKCEGWCLGEPDGAEYRRRIGQATALFRGKLPQLKREIQHEMERAAENLEFEKAAALRDQVRALSVLTKQQQVIAGLCADTDVWGLYCGQVRCGAAVLHIEDGSLSAREVRVFPAAAEEDEAAILAAVLGQYYLGKNALPREILLPVEFDGSDTFAALLTGNADHSVTLKVPQRGERAELVRMAAKNAKEEVERITTDTERVNRTLLELQELAGLPRFPRRIEAYDISNTGADDIVSGMVVFQNGKPLKRDYRKFSIEGLSRPDDYASMQQTLERRLRRYLDGDEKFAPLPDLLLIDGGLGHVHAAKAALHTVGLDIPTLGMVKDDRHRTRALITAQGEELGIQSSPPLFTLIGQIQEEIHRYAISYHRQKHRKSTYRSKLDGVPGLGDTRKKALLKRFGTVRAIEAASLADLESVLPQNVAKALYEKLRMKNEK